MIGSTTTLLCPRSLLYNPIARHVWFCFAPKGSDLRLCITCAQVLSKQDWGQLDLQVMTRVFVALVDSSTTRMVAMGSIIVNGSLRDRSPHVSGHLMHVYVNLGWDWSIFVMVADGRQPLVASSQNSGHLKKLEPCLLGYYFQIL